MFAIASPPAPRSVRSRFHHVYHRTTREELVWRLDCEIGTVIKLYAEAVSACLRCKRSGDSATLMDMYACDARRHLQRLDSLYYVATGDMLFDIDN